MSENKQISFDPSVLYRCNQKYFDKQLMQYDIGYTHLILLTQIYEDEGIAMNKLANDGAFDKGTITKSIQKLEQLSYVKIVDSSSDKRSKSLYTTSKAQDIMPTLYKIKNDWKDHLLDNIDEDEFKVYADVLSRLVDKAKEYTKVEIEDDDVKFYGLQKLTLLDYPGLTASTVFTGGCNFRCPFCHNKSLVFLSENDQQILESDIVEFFRQRGKILDGICITGGEPLLHKGLKDFVKRIKNLGLKVKLDTNGSNATKLKEIVEEGLVDYVAVDIKNSQTKYAETIGLPDYDISNIKETITYLLENHVDYEFRTTVVSEFHNIEDIEEIGKWIKGAKRYYLQSFKDHGTCIKEGLHEVDVETLKKMKEIVKPYVDNVDIRGVEV